MFRTPIRNKEGQERLKSANSTQKRFRSYISFHIFRVILGSLTESLKWKRKPRKEELPSKTAEAELQKYENNRQMTQAIIRSYLSSR